MSDILDDDTIKQMLVGGYTPNIGAILISHRALQAKLAAVDGNEKQLVQLSSWCKSSLGLDTNTVIGKEGWESTLVGCVIQHVQQRITAMEEALKALLVHDYAEDCQECAIGKSDAWKQAQHALKGTHAKPAKS